MGIYSTRIEMKGKRFGKLLVTKFAYTEIRHGVHIAFWRCLCDCGKETIKRGSTLRFGTTRSCGCGIADNNRRRTGAKSPVWAGDRVSYTQLHAWVRNQLPKPESCRNCYQPKPLDLANISGQYKRDLSDWEWLCRTCHMNKDGRMGNLHRYAKGNTPWNKGLRWSEKVRKKISESKTKHMQLIEKGGEKKPKLPIGKIGNSDK
jgi:hypothetical protein